MFLIEVGSWVPTFGGVPELGISFENHHAIHAHVPSKIMVSMDTTPPCSTVSLPIVDHHAQRLGMSSRATWGQHER